MKVQHITEEDLPIKIKEVTLLSLEEYYEYKDLIPGIFDSFIFWWTKTSVGIASAYAIDDVDGSVYEFGYGVNLNSMGVRPVLKLSGKGLKPKDRVFIDGNWFTVLDVKTNALAISDKILFKSYFNTTEDNTWETSLLKKDLEQRFSHLIK